MIPKLTKGRGITGALAYAMGQGNDPETGERLVLQSGEKSRATILGGQNFGFEIDTAERLDLARRVMEWQGLPANQGSKTRKQDLDCLHASLAWEPGQKPSREEMLRAGTEFLKAIGLEKARAVFVAHDDTDHPHIHVVASRIDPETGKTLRVDYDKAAAQRWALDWEEAHGQQRTAGKGLHALREAVKGQDIRGVLSYLTRDKPTFQAWELNRALQYGGLDGKARDAFRAEIVGHADTIGLRDSAQEPVTRYTTRAVLADEMTVLRDAAQLAGHTSHGLDAKRLEAVSRDHTLKPEQAAALRHLAGAQGLAILWGEAGTGKSHTLNALRASYEDVGKSVIGLSWTNQVVEQMRGDGFDRAATVAGELRAVKQDRAHWNRNTVLIVDEAAMLSTDALKSLAAAARNAGAKLILAGDDAQLSSIERGGLFETLRQKHGAAILKEIQRVQDAAQQAAFGAMHRGDFATALKTYEKRGAIHWTRTQSEALKKMAGQYVAEAAATPEKTRFMFAYTNKDVEALNAAARALRQQRGDIGEGHAMQTAHGPQSFAEGDRIQFTANGWTPAAKRAGFVNGRAGTVEGIQIDGDGRAYMTVALDAKKGREPRRVRFAVGEDAASGEFNSFRHGYAGTIYRGQGATLDQVFVAHSAHWRSSAAYVALTRHRNDVHIYAARETVADIDTLARALARSDGKRAATAFHIDSAELIDLHKALEAAEYRRGRGHDSGKTIAPAAKVTESGIAQALDSVANTTGKAIEILADAAESLLGGGSSRPQPTSQGPPDSDPRPTTARERREARMKSLLDSEEERRKAAAEALKREFGRDLGEEETARIQRDRDRGGGQSR